MKRASLCLGVWALLGSLVAAASAERGMELFRANQFQEAEALLRAAVQSENAGYEVWQAYGTTLLRLEKRAEARAALEKAVEMNPERPGPRLALAEAAALEGNFDQARELAEEASAYGDHAYLPYVRALVLAGERKHAEAAPLFEQACEKDPRNAYAHYYAGLSYNALRRSDRLVNHFQSFLKLAPRAPEAPRVQSILRSIR